MTSNKSNLSKLIALILIFSFTFTSSVQAVPVPLQSSSLETIGVSGALSSTLGSLASGTILGASTELTQEQIKIIRRRYCQCRADFE